MREFFGRQWGNLLTAAGLIFTIWQVMKTRSAAEAAQLAAEKALSGRLKLDALSELAAAAAMLDEIKRLHRAQTWQILPDRYAACCRHLVLVNASIQQPARLVTLAIAQLKAMENQVEVALNNQVSHELDPARFNRLISKQADRLELLLVELKKTKTGQHNA